MSDSGYAAARAAMVCARIDACNYGATPSITAAHAAARDAVIEAMRALATALFRANAALWDHIDALPVAPGTHRALPRDHPLHRAVNSALEAFGPLRYTYDRKTKTCVVYTPGSPLPPLGDPYPHDEIVAERVEVTI